MTTTTEEKSKLSTRLVGLTSLVFILLQSLCTAVIAVSAVRVAIGLSALAAATVGVNHPSRGWHQDAIRIPMLVIATLGSLINLYVIWRIRTLRARPSSAWRMQPRSQKQLRSERFQIALAIITLVLVVIEQITHVKIHHGL